MHFVSTISTCFGAFGVCVALFWSSVCLRSETALWALEVCFDVCLTACTACSRDALVLPPEMVFI
ncbi:hypothetical protein J4Q44_G00317990 [Coregonus suidteri]|uniref:Uncharacterized protein n=1 Tax=Coregonus suidteri TaxID=861788 RepID=A0AAN8QFN4_9TELE